LLKAGFHLNYGQVGRIALTLQLTASLLQPVVGLYTDRRPQPYSLAVGMGITMIGLLAFAMAPTYVSILAAAAFVGIGSAVFHPEASRGARMASGGQHGMAQSLFQVGGHAGSAIGPLLPFLFIKGQANLPGISSLALLGIVLLANLAPGSPIRSILLPWAWLIPMWLCPPSKSAGPSPSSWRSCFQNSSISQA